MSPSPFAVTSPTDPASYSWEATDEGVAERFGIPVVAGPAVRPQHVARPAGDARRAARRRPVRDDASPSTRRATTAGSSRRPRPRYGVASDEVVPGAGADEILDMCTKAFLPAGEAAVISIPTYAMYRVHAEQRGGRVIAVPRRSKADGWAMDVPAVRAAAARGDARLGLQPEQPDRPRRARRRDRALLEGIAEDAAADGRPGARRRRGRGVQRVRRAPR